MTLTDKITAYDAATDAVKAAQANATAAGNAIIAKADAGDEALESGSAKVHPSKPVVLANVGGVLQILNRVD